MKIKYLVIDVDGTLTDGKIYIGNDGELFKAFHVKDGYGISTILPDIGITPIILTGRSSSILERRCKELGIAYIYQGVKNKIDKLTEILKNSGFDFSNVAYIGDDCNDLSCMKIIKEAGGLVGCPADAAIQVIKIADFVSKKGGGNGAVRDFIDWIVINFNNFYNIIK